MCKPVMSLHIVYKLVLTVVEVTPYGVVRYCYNVGMDWENS